MGRVASKGQSVWAEYFYKGVDPMGHILKS
jgi:hypothetical protein